MAKKKAETISLQGQEYAKVAERIRLFREESPRGDITTDVDIKDDGSAIFKARVTKDRSDVTSASATGHAFGTTKGKKEFEKLESIAVGRALAMLGYLASGEIASGEEMEDFLKYQDEKKENMILESTEKINKATTLKELGEIWVDIPVEAKNSLESLKNDMKLRLSGVKVDKDVEVEAPKTINKTRTEWMKDEITKMDVNDDVEIVKEVKNENK